jgi:hypothetical protein
MKSFFEFYRMMEEDGAIPPPASSNQGGSGASSMANPASTMTKDPKQEIPPSGAVSPPVPDEKTALKEDLKTSIKNFMTQKFEPFMQKQNLNTVKAKEFMTVLIGQIMDEFGVNKSQVMQATKQATTPPQGNATTPPQGNEPKQAPIPPQAS